MVILSHLLLFSSCQTATGKFKTPNPIDAKLAMESGIHALQNKDSKTAITELLKCISADANNVECHWELGWAYFLENEFELASYEWTTVKRLSPQRVGLLQALEKINDHKNLLRKAITLRTSAIASFNPLRKVPDLAIKVHAVGDTMLGTDFPTPMLPPENTSPLIYINEYLKGSDITFANYEGTLCDGGTSEKCEGATNSCYAFRSPPYYTSFLKEAGFDVVSLANNHIFDFGESCRLQTEESLTQAGILWSGRATTVARFERKSIKFSMIAFHSALHTNSTLDIQNAKQMIRTEKKAGRLVIVSFHGGAEGFKALHTPQERELYMGENRGHVTLFARGMVDAGADLILGSGPHVVRGMEIYKNRLIAYSLGNFATYKAFNIWGFNGTGAILETKMDRKGKFVSGRIIPTKQINFGFPIYDDKQITTDLIRLLSLEDFPTNGVAVALDGTFGRKSDARRKIAMMKALARRKFHARKVRAARSIAGQKKAAAASRKAAHE